MAGKSKANQIAALNDAFRRTFIGGKVLMTSGVSSFRDDLLQEIVDGVQTYLSFTPDNDPHNEHDFGAIEILGHKFFWKIDYYDKTMCAGSEDPADPEKTTRVLTIMCADEY